MHDGPMNPFATRILLLAATTLIVSSNGAPTAEVNPRPLFEATLTKEKTPGHAVEVDVDVTGRRKLILVTTGPSFADWAEPRLIGPDGETKLTELKWQFSHVGWDMVRVDQSSWGRPLLINDRAAAYGLFVHAPSMIVYDLPPGTTRFRARAGLDHGPSDNITFAVYADNPLLDRRNAPFWQPSNDPPSAKPPTAYIEMIGGDRLPGEVVDYRGRESTSDLRTPHFLVQPQLAPEAPAGWLPRRVRVAERFVRRIAWNALAENEYRPATVFFADGRKVPFQSVRFGRDSVKLLTRHGLVTVPVAEIAELHLPRRDPWQAYFEQQAVLCPEGASPIVYLETTGGARLTVSAGRAAVRGSTAAQGKLRWWSVVQPAWCLDPLYLAADTIRTRVALEPHEVPLTRMMPVESRVGAAFSGARRRRIDRNVQGGPLTAGGETYRWGIGVNAPSELTFSVPAYAVAIRTRVGLDRIAGDGGCARARIFVGSTQAKPLFESPVLVGAARTVDTDRILLPPAADDAPRQLILQADPVRENPPEGADPLDIRDTLDWLEPVLQLDPGRLRAEVAKRSEHSIAPWRDWTVVEGRKAYRLVSTWDDVDPAPSRFRTTVAAAGGPLTLTREVHVDAESRWLVASTSRPETGASRPATIELFVNDETVAHHEVPLRNGETRAPPPLAVSLAEYEGQDVTLRIVQSGGGPVYWEALDVADHVRGLLCLYEDDGRFEVLDGAPADSVELTEEDRFAGDRAVKLSAPSRVRLIRPGEILRIRKYPEWGEYRYMRLAFRKVGSGRVFLELEHAEEAKEPARYDAGRGEPCGGSAIRLWPWDLPDAWIAPTIDLHGDLGDVDLSGLVLGCPDDGHVLFDHVYLARTWDDFNHLPPCPSADDTNRLARIALSSSVRQRAMPAMVAFQRSNGWWGSGILVDSSKGIVLTAGHLIAGSKRQFDVYLPDGSKVTGQRLGIDRAADVGALRLDGKGPWPSVEIDFQPRPSYPDDLFYLPITHPKAFEPGKEPEADFCAVRGRRAEDGLLDTNFSFYGRCRGGPLLDHAGKVIGVHSRFSPESGACLYVRAEDFAATWPRVVAGETFGTWPASICPKLGVVVTSTADGCRINVVDPQSPAKEAGLTVGDLIVGIDDVEVRSLEQMNGYFAGKDPGNEVTVRLKRGEKTSDQRIRLMQHRVVRAQAEE